jgi:hypothetical protein
LQSCHDFYYIGKGVLSQEARKIAWGLSVPFYSMDFFLIHLVIFMFRNYSVKREMLKMYAKRKKELFERVCVRQIIKLDSEGKEKKTLCALSDVNKPTMNTVCSHLLNNVQSAMHQVISTLHAKRFSQQSKNQGS